VTQLQTAPFLPLTKGIVDSANSSLEMTGAVRSMAGFNLSALGKLITRAGDSVVLTLKDDAGSPANVTSVCGVWQFKDRAIAIAHSTVTNKCYLYVLKSDLSDWYNGTTGALTGNTSPQPAAVIWSSITVSPDVFVAEGLGTLYIAHAQGNDANNLNFATRSWSGAFAVALADLTADLDGAAGAETLYFNGVIAFQNHLWAWGFGSGTTATTGYDPSKARFSLINFGNFAAADSVTLGNRVKSDRERIICGGLAGNALVLQGTYITSRITGYGRSSWYREIVDEANGITGPKAGVSDGGYWYYWSSQGPMRIGPSGPVEPLDEPVRALVASVVNPEKIVAGRDYANNTIFFLVDTGAGIRVKAAYHVRRGLWTTTSDDVGLVLNAVGEVTPVVGSVSAGAAGPSGAPTSATNTLTGQTTSTAGWTTGDSSAQTEVSLGTVASGAYSVVTTLSTGVSSYAFTGLTPGTAYQWRVRHVKNGQYSGYLSSTFTTTASSGTLQPPTNPGATALSTPGLVTCSWTNSGESGVSVEIWHSTDAVNYTLADIAVGGASSKTVRNEPSGTLVRFKMRHTKSGSTPSDFTSIVSATVQ
jgi:hypothetical protein